MLLWTEQNKVKDVITYALSNLVQYSKRIIIGFCKIFK